MGSAIGKSKGKSGEKRSPAEAKAPQQTAGAKGSVSVGSGKIPERSESLKRRKAAREAESGAPSKKKVKALFEQYAAGEESMGESALLAFCEDLDVAPEAVEVLVLSFHFRAKQECRYSREEFTEGMLSLGCDSLAKLKARMADFGAELDDSGNLREVFEWAFDWSKESPDKRTIDFDTVEFLVELLLLRNAARFPLAVQVAEFLNEQTSYKAVNQDQWVNILDFCTQIEPDLSNYDETSSWPVLLDEYVDWLRQKDPKKYPAPTRDGGTPGYC